MYTCACTYRPMSLQPCRVAAVVQPLCLCVALYKALSMCVAYTRLCLYVWPIQGSVYVWPIQGSVYVWPIQGTHILCRPFPPISVENHNNVVIFNRTTKGQLAVSKRTIFPLLTNVLCAIPNVICLFVTWRVNGR